MNKDNIITIVRELHLPPGEFVVVGGSVLAAHEIRPTADIDIVASPTLFESLKKKSDWLPIERPSGEPGITQGSVEIYPDVNCPSYQPESYDLIERSEIIDGIPFASLHDILEFKKGYGREKDLIDVQLIEKYLTNKIS